MNHHTTTTLHSGDGDSAVFFESGSKNGKLASWIEAAGWQPAKAYDDVCERMLVHREDCEDWHVKGADIKIRHFDGRVFLTRAGREGQAVCFNERSLRQFCKSLGLHYPTVRKLHADGALPLMADLMNHYLHGSKNREHLLRLCVRRGDESAAITHDLRAFLPANYNRLDNIYLLSGIRRACREHALCWKDIYFDRDNFMCLLILRDEENERSFLKGVVGEEFVCGISIENSEVGGLDGSGDSLKVKIYFERLVCTNGMTAKGTRVLQVENNLNIGTHYHDVLPPHPLGFGLQEQIDDFLVDEVIGQLLPDIDKQAQRLQKQAETMHAQEIRMESEAHAKAIIREAIKMAGMMSNRGISIPCIYDALVRGRREWINFPATITAWELYNAVTDYASGLIRGGRRGIGRNYRLGSALTRDTYRLSDLPLDWQEIQGRTEGVAREASKRTKPAPVNPPNV